MLGKQQQQNPHYFFFSVEKYFSENCNNKVISVHQKDTTPAQNNTEEDRKSRGNIKNNLCRNGLVSIVKGTGIHYD